MSSSRSSRAAATAARPRTGRPPRVSTQQIIEVALELGLDTVSFRDIARHLGVAPATLYRHINSRDELIRLAAFELALRRRLPQCGREHWSQLATRYAESLFQSFVAQPQLIAELLRGRLGPHAEIDVLEQFLEVLAPHGFSDREGAALFHSIGMLILGAASGAIGFQASVESDAPWSQRVRQALAERDDDELPRVRGVFSGEAFEGVMADWRRALQALLSGTAAARGEVLPPCPPSAAVRGAT